MSEELDRDTLGKMVRYAWILWAKEQPDPKPSWLLPWEELSEEMREVDRRIGGTVAKAVLSIERAQTRGDHELAEAVRAVTGAIPGQWGRWPDDQPPPTCKRCGEPMHRMLHEGREQPHYWRCANNHTLMTPEL